MEATVKILRQNPLVTTEYTDKETGEKKMLSVVTMELSDGVDKFIGEITGERAEKCGQYDTSRNYRVKCSMVIREWTSEKTGKLMKATTIYIDKINPV